MIETITIRAEAHNHTTYTLDAMGVPGLLINPPMPQAANVTCDMVVDGRALTWPYPLQIWFNALRITIHNDNEVAAEATLTYRELDPEEPVAAAWIQWAKNEERRAYKLLEHALEVLSDHDLRGEFAERVAAHESPDMLKAAILDFPNMARGGYAKKED